MKRHCNLALILAGLFGFSAVAFSAYTNHVLKDIVSGPDFARLETALVFQLFHAVLLAALGIGQNRAPFDAYPRKRLGLAAFFFAFGTAFFCGSLDAGVLFKDPKLFGAAPLGGTMLMLGWLCLAAAGLGRCKMGRFKH